MLKLSVNSKCIYISFLHKMFHFYLFIYFNQVNQKLWLRGRGEEKVEGTYEDNQVKLPDFRTNQNLYYIMEGVVLNKTRMGYQPALYQAYYSVWHPYSNKVFPNTHSKLTVAQLSAVPILPFKSRAWHHHFPLTRSAESRGVTSWPPVHWKISASSYRTCLPDPLSALLPSSGHFHSPLHPFYILEARTAHSMQSAAVPAVNMAGEAPLFDLLAILCLMHLRTWLAPCLPECTAGSCWATVTSKTRSLPIEPFTSHVSHSRWLPGVSVWEE